MALDVKITFDGDQFQLAGLALIEALSGGEVFMSWPDRWWEAHVWRCPNGHVSTTVLRSEALGRDACLACREPVHLTFPEDREGPLNVYRHPMMAMQR